MKFLLLLSVQLLFFCKLSFANGKSEFRIKQFFEKSKMELVELDSSHLVFNRLNSDAKQGKVYWYKASKSIALFTFIDTVSNSKIYFIENKKEGCFYQSVLFLDMKTPSIEKYSDLIQFSEAWIRFDYFHKSVVDISRFALNPDTPHWVIRKSVVIKENGNYFKHEKVLVKRFLFFDPSIDLEKVKSTKLKFVSLSENLQIIDIDKMKPTAFRLGYQIMFRR